MDVGNWIHSNRSYFIVTIVTTTSYPIVHAVVFLKVYTYFKEQSCVIVACSISLCVSRGHFL